MTRLRVLGVPAPQGSKSAVVRAGKAVLIEGSSTTGRVKHAAWRTAVAWTASNGSEPLDGPLSIDVTFRLPMPKSRPAAIRRAGIGPHACKPDLDKLLRSTFDGLKDAGLIVDDSRICAVSALAIETTGWTGADIEINPFNPLGDPQ